MPFDMTMLAPEERELVAQLGKESRPFGPDLKADMPRLNIISRAYYALTAAPWEIIGVDTSYWQGKIDFSILKTLAKFVIIRAGYGNDYFDPNMADYIQGCYDNDLPWGIYWFIVPGKDWRKQALNFSETWKTSGGYIYPCIDLEVANGLDKNALHGWCVHFYQELQAKTGLPYDKMMTYTSANFFNTKMPLSDIFWRTELDVAHWTTAPSPTMPLEWTNHKKSYIFWQHSSKGDGNAHGAESDYIDLQRFYGTAADFKRLFGISPPMPPAPSVPTFVKINTAELNIRVLPNDDSTLSIIGKTSYGKIWKTTGIQSEDAKGRGYWYQVADEHGQVLWLAGWLCVPA